LLLLLTAYTAYKIVIYFIHSLNFLFTHLSNTFVLYIYIRTATKINSISEDLKIHEKKKNNIIKRHVHIINLFCHGLKFDTLCIFIILLKNIKRDNMECGDQFFFDFLKVVWLNVVNYV